MDYKELLETKGFNLNTYSKDKFWELEVTNNEELKRKICKAFQADIELFDNGTDVDTLILQCADDYTRCLFYYDCNSFNMETEEFMKCIGQM